MILCSLDVNIKWFDKELILLGDPVTLRLRRRLLNSTLAGFVPIFARALVPLSGRCHPSLQPVRAAGRALSPLSWILIPLSLAPSTSAY